METEPGLLLSLLAVRLLGGQSVPVASPVLKELKTSIKTATDQGLLKADKVKLPVTKAGKTKIASTAVVALTDDGKRLLQQTASPEALNATIAGHLAGLKAEGKLLRDDLMAAIAPKAKAKGDGSLSKELSALSKTVKDLADRLQKLETAVQSSPDDQLLAKVDRAFEALTARFDSVMHALPSPGPSATTLPHASVPVTPPPVTAAQPLATGALQAALYAAYERLCCFREFQNRLVELPRLYHETLRSFPGLSVEAFRRTLEALWESKTVELHILNEVRDAKEPDKAIRRDNKLYYFVYWRTP